MKFENTGETFGGYRNAEQWLKINGYSIGSMCHPLPTGFKRGDYVIAKWKNLSADDIEALDGKILGDFREGDVELVFTKAEGKE